MSILRSVFASVFGKRPGPLEVYGAPVPDRALYVIGDIHGRDDLLLRLLELIHDDIAAHRPEAPQLVLLGDYVDRGDRSAEVLGLVRQLHDAQDIPTVCLRGNHEEMMLSFLEEPERAGPSWLRNGGLQTLASYGVSGATEASPPERLVEVSAALLRCVGDETVAWLDALELLHVSGNVAAVHAAMDPGLPPHMQEEPQMLWGSRDFLTTARTDGLWVVHGHTIVDAPEIRPSRIAVDTGAVFTGRLTAAALSPEGTVRFLQT